jgi:hypothetical protein
MLGVVAYYGIIQSKNMPTKYLVGFGFVIPVVLYLPFPIIEMFDIQSPQFAPWPHRGNP